MKQFIKNEFDCKETILILAVAFLWNQGVYLGARYISQTWHHYNMTTSIDQLIPFLPWTISVYFGCYLFWCVNYYLCAIQSKAKRDRFFCADLLAKGICFLLFLLLPTTNTRPEIVGETIWDILMKLLYQLDAADNLFPSIHCLVSWFCWIGVREQTELPALYRYFSLTAAIAVCISTMTTKQHVLADVVGGIVLAEACYYIAKNPKISTLYSTIISRIKNIFSK